MLRKAIFLWASSRFREGTAAVPRILSSSPGWIVRVDSTKICLGLSLTQGLCCCILLLLCGRRFPLGYGTIFVVCSRCSCGYVSAVGVGGGRMGAGVGD